MRQILIFYVLYGERYILFKINFTIFFLICKKNYWKYRHDRSKNEIKYEIELKYEREWNVK